MVIREGTNVTWEAKVGYRFHGTTERVKFKSID